MKYKLIKDVIKYMPKSKIKAGEGLEKGVYPFFTSSPIQNKYYDEYIYDDECIIIGTGGHATIHYYKGKFSTSTDNFVVKFNGYNMRFIYHYLQANINILESKFKGAGLKHISKDGLESILLPDIEMEEQARICNIMDKVYSEITIKKNEIRKLDLLTKSQFVEMFGNINDNKNDYEIKELSEVFEFIKDGTHSTPTYTDDKINGIKFLSAKDVTKGTINWKNIKYIPLELHEQLVKRVKPQKDDILLAKNGTTGVCAKVDTDDVFDIYVSLALLRPKEGVSTDYLVHAINNDVTKEQFDRSLKGVGVPNLHLGEIKKVKIIVPPIELQNKFVDIVEEIDKQKFEFEKSIKKLEELQAALMQEYFE